MNFIANAVCSSPLGFNICHLSLRFALISLKKEKGNNHKDQWLLLLLITYIKSKTVEKMPYCLPVGSLTPRILQQDSSRVREEI